MIWGPFVWLKNQIEKTVDRKLNEVSTTGVGNVLYQSTETMTTGMIRSMDTCPTVKFFAPVEGVYRYSVASAGTGGTIRGFFLTESMSRYVGSIIKADGAKNDSYMYLFAEQPSLTGKTKSEFQYRSVVDSFLLGEDGEGYFYCKKNEACMLLFQNTNASENGRVSITSLTITYGND